MIQLLGFSKSKSDATRIKRRKTIGYAMKRGVTVAGLLAKCNKSALQNAKD
jgi:hypothetical protein